MNKIKYIKCKICGHTMAKPIGIKHIFANLFKIKRCPICNIILISETYTKSSGPH